MNLVHNNPEAGLEKFRACRLRITRQREPVVRRLCETPLRPKLKTGYHCENQF